jgi:hypothetical protein
MHADKPPRAVFADQDVGGSELPVVGLTAVSRLLIMDSDHHCGIAEHTHRGVTPIER